MGFHLVWLTHSFCMSYKDLCISKGKNSQELPMANLIQL